MQQSLVSPSTPVAVAIAAGCVLIMGISIIGFGWLPHMAIIVVICGLLLLGKWQGLGFKQMQAHMAEGMLSGVAAIYLFFFIGLLVAALMVSGTIPTLMYYGFELISPEYFYLSAFVLTSIIGVAIGSSLTTCATLGVAFISMSGAFAANPAIAAGAIVSGAFFADKMSPLSDTCSIAAATVGIDLFAHIRNMMYTTVPAWLLTALLLLLLSDASNQAQLAEVLRFKSQLQASGLIHGYALLPIGVLIVLAVRKVNAIYTMMATIAVAIILTYLHSSPSLSQLGEIFFAGFTPDRDLGVLNDLVSRGGMQSMFFTQAIVILALSLGGLLQALGVLSALLAGIAHLLTTAGRATFAAAMTALGVNVLIGEQYLSLLLSGTTYKPVYERLHLHPRNLSRTIEDAGTVINPLVPWSVCGVFISNVLGVSVLSYLPYAFFCYLCLLLTLLFGFTGFTISSLDDKPIHTVNPQSK